MPDGGRDKAAPWLRWGLLLCSALSKAGHGVLLQWPQVLQDKPLLVQGPKPSVIPTVSGWVPQGTGRPWAACGYLYIWGRCVTASSPTLQGTAACTYSWREKFQFWVPKHTRQEEKQHVKDAKPSWKSWQSRGRAGNESPSPGFWRFSFWSGSPQFQWRETGRAQAQRHQILQGQKFHEKTSFLHIRNLWRKRPFSKAGKSFELLHEWQIHLILKAGEHQHLTTTPDLPSLTRGQTSDFRTS